MGHYRTFATTVIGGTHIKQGKHCEDASCCKEIDYLSIAVVADGHGESNCFRSAKGAKLAVACAAKGIQDFVKSHEANLSCNEFEKILRDDLVRYTIASWHKLVEDDFIKNPFTVEELEKADDKHRKKYEAGNNFSKAYGATLIAAAITPHYWFGIQIGDGRFTTLEADGSHKQPVPWDEKCYLNVTTSICDDDTFERARYYVSFIDDKNPAPIAIFLCTDGIDDNYPIEENDKHLFKLYRTIALTFAEDGFDSTCKQLNDLATSFATKGKRDDTSIAGFINMEALIQMVPIWQNQIDYEKPVVGEAVTTETETVTEMKTDMAGDVSDNGETISS